MGGLGEGQPKRKVCFGFFLDPQEYHCPRNHFGGEFPTVLSSRLQLICGPHCKYETRVQGRRETLQKLEMCVYHPQKTANRGSVQGRVSWEQRTHKDTKNRRKPFQGADAWVPFDPITQVRSHHITYFILPPERGPWDPGAEERK